MSKLSNMEVRIEKQELIELIGDCDSLCNFDDDYIDLISLADNLYELANMQLKTATKEEIKAGVISYKYDWNNDFIINGTKL